MNIFDFSTIEKFAKTMEKYRIRNNLKSYISNWNLAFNKEEWFDPPNGKWRQLVTEPALIIDNDGNVIEPPSIKEKWAKLLEEADINLGDEDNACNDLEDQAEDVEDQHKE